MDNSAKELAEFVEKFRNATPYINNFRDKTFVIYFSGDILINNSFPSLIHDLSLLHSLGIKLVLVHGSRKQIAQKLAASNVSSEYEVDQRVTNKETLNIAKEVSGTIRFDLEALFSSFFKYLPNIDRASPSQHQLNVISGNFVTAKPMGIINGIDFQYTGVIRKIHTDEINTALSNHSIVLISPLGASPTGEIFNLNSEDLATECAIALGADKLVFITEIEGIYDENKQRLSEITSHDVQHMIDSGDNNDQHPHYQRIIQACSAGVNKVQLVSQNIDGALLLELFTAQGHGTLITADTLEEISLATVEDVSSILELIEPLELNNTIVKRSRETLEIEVGNFYVLKREQKVIACSALYQNPSDQDFGELACMAVMPEYQDKGRGDKLFKWLCQQSKKSGIKKIYALTTQTAHWFLERGFYKAEINDLPLDKQQSYNYRRNSAVYIKEL
jgi:amino-acid N-acetyltransferase